MNHDASNLINGYLDDCLTPEQQQSLRDWLKESPDNARQFASSVMLHDRVRGEMLALTAMAGDSHVESATTGEASGTIRPAEAPASKGSAPFSPRLSDNVRQKWSGIRPYSAVFVAAFTLVFTALLWRGSGDNSASASTMELKRIIAANAELIDHTYQINMENEDPEIRQGGRRPPPPDHRRPPHPRPPHGRPVPPPMNGAILYVRGGRQFVLVRKGLDGRLFTTGCNGKLSWSIGPEGPVRVSDDPNRFRRGVPGQSHSVPLVSIHEGLEGLLSAYDIEMRDSPLQVGDETCQQLIADRRSPTHLGARRVEITYSVRTGRIQDMVFVDMPRSQQLPVIIHLQLIEERDLGADFFDHQAHHEPGRPVRYEE